MLEDLWTGILDLTAKFVLPDWGALIALLPIFVAFGVVAILLWVFLRLFHAPPARRGKGPVPPRTPDGIHMPGPSFAPILASIGAFLLFLGLVFGGLLLIVGAIALVVTLLYWLGEALHLYDHDFGDRSPGLPAVIHDGPPEGVHLPGPSFRPILGAIGTTMLFLGLVFGEWLLAVGVIALVLTLVGWLIDARKEYVKTVEADATGHLENIAAPRTPSGLLIGLGVLLIGAVLIQGGWVPPGAAGGEVPSAPPASGEPGPAPSGETPSGETPSGAPSGPPAAEADITLVAAQLAFDRTEVTGPADAPFSIALVNDDQSIPHNVELKDAAGASVFTGEIFNGVETRVYEVPALPAGTYTFLCTVHPTMTGTAALQ